MGDSAYNRQMIQPMDTQLQYAQGLRNACAAETCPDREIPSVVRELSTNLELAEKQFSSLLKQLQPILPPEPVGKDGGKPLVSMSTDLGCHLYELSLRLELLGTLIQSIVDRIAI